jgi:cation diffusion facilitator CzcD-associated flavoprotein CzcO
MSADVIVVGAGMTGIGAAYHLRQAGIPFASARDAPMTLL